MKPRDGDDSIKDSTPFGRKGRAGAKATGAPVLCRACRAEIPAQPGFRPSAQKCPKCGAAAGRSS